MRWSLKRASLLDFAFCVACNKWNIFIIAEARVRCAGAGLLQGERRWWGWPTAVAWRSGLWNPQAINCDHAALAANMDVQTPCIRIPAECVLRGLEGRARLWLGAGVLLWELLTAAATAHRRTVVRSAAAPSGSDRCAGGVPTAAEVAVGHGHWGSGSCLWHSQNLALPWGNTKCPSCRGARRILFHPSLGQQMTMASPSIARWHALLQHWQGGAAPHSHLSLPVQCTVSMGAEFDSHCPVCLDTQDNTVYVMPCLLQFCCSSILV